MDSRGQVSDPVNHLFIPAILLVVWFVIATYTIEWLGLIGYLVVGAIVLATVIAWAMAAPIYPKERYDS